MNCWCRDLAASFLSRAVVLVAAGAAVLTPGAPHASADSGLTPTSPNLKVAFIGDQDIGPDAEAVLTLIANEGTDMVIHQGDFGYGNEVDPQTAIDWDAQITSILGSDFPYFASVGNHDLGNWATYQQLLLDRLARVADASCSGDVGVQASCTFQGLFFILSGPGTMGTNHTTYIENELALDSSIWRVCSWHKNQTAMQVGSKLNDVGWGPYEACRQGRAIIATGHEHSYERTKTLTSMQSQTIDQDWPDPNVLRVSHGSTFAFVSGLAGKDVRNQDRCLPTAFPYGCNGEWASIYTSNQGATFGALFIEFNVGGNPAMANGYFKDIAGNTVDTFTILSDLPKAVGGVATLPVVAGSPTSERDNALGFLGPRATGETGLVVVGFTSLVAVGWLLRRRLGGRYG